MKKKLFIRAILLVLLTFCSKILHSQTVYTENFGQPDAVYNVDEYSSWQNSNVLYSGFGCDLKTTYVSTLNHYEFASGGGNLQFNDSAEYFLVENIVTAFEDSLVLSFGMRKGQISENGSGFHVSVSADGKEFRPLKFDTLPVGTGSVKYYWIQVQEILPLAASLSLRFFTSNSNNFRLDDIHVARFKAPVHGVNTGADSIPKQLQYPELMITEVYGGGGNAGASYRSDFVELYNPRKEPVFMNNWSLQYYSATGQLPSRSLIFPPNTFMEGYSHFLISLSSGETGEELILPDLVTNMPISASSGKILLFRTMGNQELIDLDNILSNEFLVDYLPYGRTAQPQWGSPMEKDGGAAFSATRKILSNGNYSFSGNIGTDWQITAPSPTSGGMITGLNRPQAILSPGQVFQMEANSENAQRFDRFNILIQDGRINLELNESAFVRLFSLNGSVLLAEYLKSGRHVLSIHHKGFYILRANNQSYFIDMQK